MIRGMYASAAGMLTGIARQDLYAGNLANANTVGYRRLGCGTRSFGLALKSVSEGGEQLRGGAGPVDEVLDLAEGALKTTGSRFDVAISGPGFLAVQTPQGVRYTRDGRLQANAAGLLADARGNPVVGANGTIGVKGDIDISETGQVKSGGKFVGELLIADLPAASLKPAGDNLYASSATPQRSVAARIVQGSLEDSNASAMQELAAMMRNSRYYEANAAALRQQDQTLEGLVRLIGE